MNCDVANAEGRRPSLADERGPGDHLGDRSRRRERLEGACARVVVEVDEWSLPVPDALRQGLHERFQITRPIDGRDEHGAVLDHHDEVGHAVHDDGRIWRVHDVVARVDRVDVAWHALPA